MVIRFGGEIDFFDEYFVVVVWNWVGVLGSVDFCCVFGWGLNYFVGFC